MLNKLKKIIFVVLMTGGIVATYNCTSLDYIRWPLIFGIMLLGIILTEIFLNEDPLELFNCFTMENWKNAKISSVLMIGDTVALIMSFISLYKAMISNL